MPYPGVLRRALPPAALRHRVAARGEGGGGGGRGHPRGRVSSFVERFDIEPFSDFSAK